MLPSLKKFLKKISRHYTFSVNKVYIAKGTFLGGNVKIGKFTRINNPSYIDNCEIGAFCALAGRLVIRSSNHAICYPNVQDWAQKNLICSETPVAGYSKGPLRIGNAVWIGDSVIILSGVDIGNGAVIGAGSVVTKSVPDFAIAVGNPAKVIKYRFSKDIIELLSRIAWWDWSVKKIKRNKIFFETDFTNLSYEEAVKVISEIRE
jgi:acetyltransferase-like isoleucine patch superfamily enzyme